MLNISCNVLKFCVFLESNWNVFLLRFTFPWSLYWSPVRAVKYHRGVAGNSICVCSHSSSGPESGSGWGSLQKLSESLVLCLSQCLVAVAFLCSWLPLSSLFVFFSKCQSVSQFSRSVVSDSVTPWITARQASLSITNSRSLLKPMSIESVMPSSHLIFCRPLLLLSPILPTIRDFSNESVLHIRWPKYWSFSFSISPSNEQPGLISFRIDWLDLLAVQGTRKSLLQRHSQMHQYFSAQLSLESNSYIHTWLLEKP